MTQTDEASERPRLLLIDGHSVAYRAFYALPVENFSTSTGQHTNAVYGFTAMLINVLRDEQPLEPEAFAEFLAAQPDMSPKSWPRYVWLADDLPSTATNKILKRELVALGTEPAGRVLWQRDGTVYTKI